MIGHYLTLRNFSRRKYEDKRRTSTAEGSGIASSSWMPKTWGRTQERKVLHDNDETLLGTSCRTKSEAAMKSKYHRKSAEVIRLPEIVPRDSSYQKPFPLLLQNQQILKDDDSSTFGGGHNCHTCLGCNCLKPLPLLPQHLHTMKICRIFRGVYILVKIIRAMTCNEGLSNNFEATIISQHLKLEELPDRLNDYFSLWPYIEFDKDKVIRLWIAQGFFDFEYGRGVEIEANKYFEDMLKVNRIVQSRFDRATGRIKYKVGYSCSNSWVQEAQLSSIAEEVQNLFLLSESFGKDTLKTLQKFNQLRNLVLSCPHEHSIKRVPDHLFLKMQHLRTLDLHATNITHLPYSISSLSSLRYLDVSETPIKLLPESIGRLWYLQILKLEHCSNFSGLPYCTSKLVNLRHLDLDIVGQLSSMPVGMGNLTRLQTLEGFILGKGEGYGVRELRQLTDLRGSIEISRLENISNVEEAREVELNKKHLDKLELRWGHHLDDFPFLVEEILECLQPHLSLKELQISFYYGSRFPTWMSNSYLSNIVSITLLECKSCINLPFLGGLQSLKSLFLFRMYGVRSIDSRFCRYGGSQVGPAFPKLEKLEIDGMPKLEKWTGVKNGDFPCLLQLSVICCPKLVAIPMLPLLSALKILNISYCYELQSFPKGKLPSKLESVAIADCPLLKKRCLKRQGKDWSKIKHIPSIFIDREEMSST